MDRQGMNEGGRGRAIGWLVFGLMLCEGDLGLLWSYSTISGWYLKLIAQWNELSCPHP